MVREQQKRDRSEQTSKNWISQIPDLVWAPLAAGFLILLVGVLGLATSQPWLFPSLGPTAFLQAELPKLPSSKFYNTVIGHFVGLISGLLAVGLLAAYQAPPVLSTGDLTAPRLWAAVLAVILNLLLSLLLKASHPPAAATTLLVSLGGFKPNLHDVMTIIAGVLIVAIAGEMLRQIRLKGDRS